MTVNKKRMIGAMCVLAVLIALIGLWLGGVFGISPIANEASFEQLAGRETVRATDVVEIQASVFGRDDGRTVKFTIKDEENIGMVVDKLTSGKFIKTDGVIPPGMSVNLTIKFSDKSTYSFNTRNIKCQILLGTKNFKFKQLSDLDNCIIKIGEALGAFD